MTRKKLIINADDFGISLYTNKAIMELFAAGKITSTSLLANGEYGDDAMKTARDNSFKVGVHLTINSDFDKRPWRSLSASSSLSDADGNLLSDTKLLAQRAISREVTAECVAQIEKVIASGVKVDHLDNHCGTMYGINGRLFFFNAFRLAARYKLPFRFPKQNGFLASNFNKGIPRAVKIAHRFVAGIGKTMRVKLIDNLITNPYKTAEIGGYPALEKYYIDAIKAMPCGITELFLHPSYYCPTYSMLTEEWKKREWELELLHSKALEDLIKNENIELISYDNLINDI